MTEHIYNLQPDPEDKNDFIFQTTRPPSVPLPLRMDLRNYCSPVRDQDGRGCCTGEAGVGLREFLAIKATGSYTPLSPIELYKLELILELRFGQDAGANLRTTMKVLQHAGVCPEADNPFEKDKFNKLPTKKMLQNGLAWRIGPYHALNSLTDIHECLAAENPIAIGFAVYESFEGDTNLTKTGVMPMPEKGEKLLGYHAVLDVGYLTNPRYLGGGCEIIKNSWSKDWGDEGYFYMPWAYMTYKNIIARWTGTLPGRM